MRLSPDIRTWLTQQATKLHKPMTQVIFDLFSFYQHSDIPQKTYLLLVNGNNQIVGTAWEGTFTGIVRLTILPATQLCALEIRCENDTFSTFTEKVIDLLDG